MPRWEEDEAHSREIAAAEECRRNVGDADNVIHRHDIIHYFTNILFCIAKRKMAKHCKLGL